tara:strand:+ start:150 stop:1133 length:984 start_codon:yes stop_codon:yes gene_type:complete
VIRKMDMTIIQAVNNALELMMKNDKDVVILGQDVESGGVFLATEGLHEKFGSKRTINTPLSESGIVGVSIGMSIYGLKPVAEIQFMDFMFPAFDQIISELAKFRYRSGGTFSCPIVIRAPYGGGIKGASYHSQSGETHFVHTPGLKVVIPSSPYNAKGLLISAIKDPDPVIFLEPKKYYRAIKEEVPEEEYSIPIGSANIVYEGDDITAISYGASLHTTRSAANSAKELGISVEVIDLLSLSPLDVEKIITSVKKTGKVVIIHEAPKTLGMSAEISALIAERALEYLEAPIQRVAGLDAPFPYTLEKEYLPDPKRILSSIKKLHEYS